MVVDLGPLSAVVKVNAIEPLEDPARGRLWEPIDDSEILAGRVVHVHVVECLPGAVRANHFHPKARETLCLIAGSFEVKLRDPSTGAEASFFVPDGSPVKIEASPGICHAFKNVGSGPAYILGFADTPFDPDDIKRCEILE